MNSLIEQKAEVARLRDLFEKETDPLIKESIRFRLAEARLWHDVAECGVLEPEQIKQVKTRKCRTTWERDAAILCFIVAGIILAVALFGCHTVNGIGQDLSAVSSPYIQEK